MRAEAKGPNYLFDELAERMAKGAVKLRIVAQLANDGDIVDDATDPVAGGSNSIGSRHRCSHCAVADNAQEQQRTIFDPIPRVDGIDPSDDPLFELRAAVYLISGRRRRAAGEASATSA